MKNRIQTLDTQDMHGAINGCYGQITEILERYADWEPKFARIAPKQVLFLGMGGSAIGGDMLRAWVDADGGIPMVVNRGYRLPNWVGKETLIIASSYSGNTEETLSAVAAAAERGAKIIAITSGGRLTEMAGEHDWDRLSVPSGFQPRAAIGYSIAAASVALCATAVLDASLLAQLLRAAKSLETRRMLWNNPDDDQNEAIRIAGQLMKMLPIIYGSVGVTEALAVRFRGQLAENSKILAGHHILPELNHNEIVGLAERIKSHQDILLLWLTDIADHARLARRRVISEELLKAEGFQVLALAGVGESLVERNLDLLHFTDWISYYAALLGGYDPSQIDILTKLKTELSRNR